MLEDWAAGELVDCLAVTRRYVVDLQHAGSSGSGCRSGMQLAGPDWFAAMGGCT